MPYPLLLLLVGFLGWPTSFIAQAQPAPLAVARQSGLTSAQARQALDVLRDDRRRAELIATLEAISAASQEAAAVAPATGPAPGQSVAPATAASPVAGPAVSKLPLEPNSLAAQLIGQLSAELEDVGAQLIISLRSVNDLPLLWRWLVNQANDPEARTLVFDAAWKLLVVVAAGLAAEWGSRRFLRRMQATLALGAQSKPTTPPPDVPPERPQESGVAAVNAERSVREDQLVGTLSALRRLPFLLGRLLLDLVPIALFAFIANVLLGTSLGDPASTRSSILLVVQCYLAARLTLSLSAMLISSKDSQLRLLHVSDWAAEFSSRWISRITIIGLTGYAIAGVGLQFNMYRTAYDTLLKLFSLVVHICLIIAVLEGREPIARRIRSWATREGPWAATLNRLAGIWHLVAIFYLVALWLVWAVELRNGYVRLIHFFIVTVMVLIVSRLVAVVLLGGLERARVLPSLVTRVPGFEARTTAYYPILRGLLLTLIAGATLLTLLEAWGFEVIGWFQSSGLGSRSLSAISVIAAMVVLAVVVWELVNGAIELHLGRLSRSAHFARAGRLRTLLPMLRTVLLVTIVLVVSLTALNELGVNTAPLLAGAGVIGIAVGFGSQKLVQDLITGLFLLLENAMQVGDVITLGGLSGTVEALSIRTIRLRAIDGSVHIIPFSAVTTVTNQTRDYGYAVVDVSVGLNEEPDDVVPILKDAADEMRSDPQWQNIVLEPLDIMGVEKFVDLAWVMRVRMKTQPSSRWSVARELNRRFKAAFDQRGVESPFTSHRALSTVPATPAPQESPA